MPNNIREIITKAVIGKSHLKTKQTYTIETPHGIDHVLGCWIVGHHYDAFLKNKKLYVEGVYDINLWYALEDGQQSEVHVEKIQYTDEMPVSTKEDVDFSRDVMLVCTCPMQPVCLEAKKTEDKSIEITVEKTLHVDMVGETKISIEVTDQKEIWDEIEESINPSFLEK